MLQEKKAHPNEKTNLHPLNKHRQPYDFKALIQHCEELTAFVKPNPYGDASIDFSNAEAVMTLNKALLRYYYDINFWSIPTGYLCPPIPGRADHLLYLADMLGSSNHSKIPNGNKIRCLDIGVGANCIYPILGNAMLGWTFVGSDIAKEAIESASMIVAKNETLRGKVAFRLQANPEDIFEGVIQPDEYFDLSICNPPFHASEIEARAGNIRKLNNLNQKKTRDTSLNFGGQAKELWCEGGEITFIETMISQSKKFSNSCLWYSTLVSKEYNLKNFYNKLESVDVQEVKTVTMHQGNKTSRFIAWTFFTKAKQASWIKYRW